MAYNLVVPVTEQIELGAGYHLIRLAAPEIAAEARAGQFVMIGLPDIDVMLIRRPFSVARVWPEPGQGKPESIDVLFKVFGKRTLAISHLRPGSEMSVLGPLGRGFWMPDDGEAELFLVAGGIGNAPFPLLLQQLGDMARRTTLFFGGRTAADLSLLDWFGARCGRVVTTTEDGSHGEKGFVTAPLARALDAEPHRPRVVMACGPPAMMKAVAGVCLERNVPCQLSIEETMACGFGVCLGCVVERQHPEGDFDRFVRVCTEGPVFDAREVRL
jgi:dihydroorotate dehydrogenase electron transfer subunit